MSWDAIRAAGTAVNSETGADYTALQSSVAHASSAAAQVARATARGPREGRYTGLGIEKFQQGSFEKNTEWRFTDRTLCVLWKLEFPDTKADFIGDCRKYVGGTRAAVNAGRHGSQGNPKP